MQRSDLLQKHCVPCEGSEAPFDAAKIEVYLPSLSLPWTVIEGKKINVLPKKTLPKVEEAPEPAPVPEATAEPAVEPAEEVVSEASAKEETPAEVKE